jgi:hypothetical protein
MAFPKTQSGSDPMLEAPSTARDRAVRGARTAVRRRPVEADGNVSDAGTPATDRESGLGIPPLDAIAHRPRLAALAGDICIAFSGIFYLWADVTPSTGTVFRALFGLPLLGAVASPSSDDTDRYRVVRCGSRSSPASSSRVT